MFDSELFVYLIFFNSSSVLSRRWHLPIFDGIFCMIVCIQMLPVSAGLETAGFLCYDHLSR